jgi:hypothetical protein
MQIGFYVVDEDNDTYHMLLPVPFIGSTILQSQTVFQKYANYTSTGPKTAIHF